MATTIMSNEVAKQRAQETKKKYRLVHKKSGIINCYSQEEKVEPNKIHPISHISILLVISQYLLQKGWN
jgi:hypothetical protein